jgi:hypothetical protein
VCKSGLHCRGLHTRDPKFYDHISQCSGTRMNRYGLQLFGFSKSPSSNRITLCTLSSPRPSLSCDASLDSSLSSTSSTPSSFTTSFSLSNSLSKFLKYAALELSSATPNQPHRQPKRKEKQKKNVLRLRELLWLLKLLPLFDVTLLTSATGVATPSKPSPSRCCSRE